MADAQIRASCSGHTDPPVWRLSPASRPAPPHARARSCLAADERGKAKARSDQKEDGGWARCRVRLLSIRKREQSHKQRKREQRWSIAPSMGESLDSECPREYLHSCVFPSPLVLPVTAPLPAVTRALRPGGMDGWMDGVDGWKCGGTKRHGDSRTDANLLRAPSILSFARALHPIRPRFTSTAPHHHQHHQHDHYHHHPNLCSHHPHRGCVLPSSSPQIFSQSQA